MIRTTAICTSITRKSASNLALAFNLLSKDRRYAMTTLYAFCREVDDVADEDNIAIDERRRQLANWRNDIHLACNGGEPRLPVVRELKPFIERHQLAYQLFDEVIKGVEMDLDISRYDSFESLEEYCYRVASVVGLLSIEIFGYQNPATRDYAIHLGKALQLTNILRDVRVDATRGRIYLPLNELLKNEVLPEEILNSEYSPRFCNLAESVAKRAMNHYRMASGILPSEDRKSLIASELMGAVYWILLMKIERRRYNVLTPSPVRLSRAHKLFLVLRTWCKITLGMSSNNYG
jgi:15-cis-phytoene synthase